MYIKAQRKFALHLEMNSLSQSRLDLLKMGADLNTTETYKD